MGTTCGEGGLGPGGLGPGGFGGVEGRVGVRGGGVEAVSGVWGRQAVGGCEGVFGDGGEGL